MKSRPLWFGFADPTGDGVWLEGNTLRFRFEGRSGALIRRDEAALPGPHNTENMAAAAAAALAVGIPERAIAKALREFRGLPHRLPTEGELHGGRHVKGSKAPHAAALEPDLESLTEPGNPAPRRPVKVRAFACTPSL